MTQSAMSKVLLWLYSGAAAGLGGVGSAVFAFVTGQAVGALNFTPRQIGAIAIGGAITSLAAYLKNSPLPKLDDEGLVK